MEWRANDPPRNSCEQARVDLLDWYELRRRPEFRGPSGGGPWGLPETTRGKRRKRNTDGNTHAGRLSAAGAHRRGGRARFVDV